MVNWTELKTVEVGDRVKSLSVKGSHFIDNCSNIKKNPIARYVEDDACAMFDLRRLVAPLGDLGRQLVKKENYGGLADVLKTYWAVKGEPDIKFDVVRSPAQLGEDWVTLRSEVVDYNKDVKTLAQFLDLGDWKKVGGVLDRLVIGGDGSNRLELQFLSTDTRKESGVQKNDLLDAGIFCTLNGNVKVAAGVHRLICTNGLTTQLNVWSNNSVDFLTNQDMLERGVSLMNWLIAQAGNKVKSVREIATRLSDEYSKGFLSKFWKSWSERVELGDLTWFDVVDDITRSVNDTLGSIRYKSLEVKNSIDVDETSHRCPTCSSLV